MGRPRNPAACQFCRVESQNRQARRTDYNPSPSVPQRRRSSAGEGPAQIVTAAHDPCILQFAVKVVF
jgi:hypothetical protein